MLSIPKLISASALPDHHLLLEFANGEKRIFDFKPNLDHPYYKPLVNTLLFSRVTVNDGEIGWATGQDYCPHTLYEKSHPANDSGV